jgi:GntR family transcriptional regulator
MPVMGTNWIAARLRRPPSLAEQAADDVRDAIRAGAFGADGRLPSEPALSQQLGVSRPTVRAALSVLEQEGLVVRRQGLGTFVRSSVAELADLLNNNAGLTETIRAAGRRPGTASLVIGEASADARIAGYLSIEPGDRVARIERVRTADGVPVAFTRDFIPADVLIDHDVTPDRIDAFVRSEGGSLYRSLSVAGLPVQYGVARVLPTLPPPDVAPALGVGLDTLLLLLEQTDYSSGDRPVLFAEEYLVPGPLSLYAYRRGPG